MRVGAQQRCIHRMCLLQCTEGSNCRGEAGNERGGGMRGGDGGGTVGEERKEGCSAVDTLPPPKKKQKIEATLLPRHSITAPHRKGPRPEWAECTQQPPATSSGGCLRKCEVSIGNAVCAEEVHNTQTQPAGIWVARAAWPHSCPPARCARCPDYGEAHQRRRRWSGQT